MSARTSLRASLIPAALLSLLAAGETVGEEQRSVSAHQHGTTKVQIAIEDKTVTMALQAPGADIVGFEHPAESAADNEAVETALGVLSRPIALFVPPANAGCETVASNVVLRGDEHHDEHQGASEETHASHAHDEHEHLEHEHAEAGHHDDHDDESGHLEFQAEYVLTCAEPAAFTGLDLVFFERFGRAQKVQFEVLSAEGARAYSVERAAPHLSLKAGS